MTELNLSVSKPSFAAVKAGADMFLGEQSPWRFVNVLSASRDVLAQERVQWLRSEAIGIAVRKDGTFGGHQVAGSGLSPSTVGAMHSLRNFMATGNWYPNAEQLKPLRSPKTTTLVRGVFGRQVVLTEARWLGCLAAAEVYVDEAMARFMSGQDAVSANELYLKKGMVRKEERLEAIASALGGMIVTSEEERAATPRHMLVDFAVVNAIFLPRSRLIRRASKDLFSLNPAWKDFLFEAYKAKFAAANA